MNTVDAIEVANKFINVPEEHVSVVLRNAIAHLIQTIEQNIGPVYTDTRSPREQVLAGALEAVTGDRNAQYGDPNDDFSRTAIFWSVLIKAEFERRIHEAMNQNDGNYDLQYIMQTIVSAPMVADMMIALKLSRNTHMRKLDNYMDIAGYAACGHHCCSAS